MPEQDARVLDVIIVARVSLYPPLTLEHVMKYSLIAGLILTLSLAACGKKEETPAPAEQAPAPAPMAETPAPPAAAPEAAPAPAASFDAAATYKTSCASCHGPDGQGMGSFPKLAGKKAAELITKMADYKAGKTVGPQTAMMAPNVAKLSDSEIGAMASYIANTFK
jgi:cytochrome c553